MENPTHVKNVGIFVECVRAALAESDNVKWTNDKHVNYRFDNKCFPSNKNQKRSRKMKSVYKIAREQAICKGLVKCGKTSHQGTIECNFIDIRSKGFCQFSLPSVADKMESLKRCNNSVIEKKTTEQVQIKKEYIDTLRDAVHKTDQPTKSFSNDQIKLERKEIDNHEHYPPVKMTTEQINMPFHHKDTLSGRLFSKGGSNKDSESLPLLQKETKNKIEIILRHLKQNINENGGKLGQKEQQQHLGELYPHLSCPVSRRWGMEVIRLLDSDEDANKGSGKIMIDSVLTESLAYECGVRKGDIVVGAFGGPVSGSKQLFRMLARADYVEMTVQRTATADDGNDDFPAVSRSNMSAKGNNNIHSSLESSKQIGSYRDETTLPSSSPLRKKRERENDCRDTASPYSSRKKIVTKMIAKPQQHAELIDMTGLEDDDNL